MSITYNQTGFPTFFADAPVLRIQDKLAEFLGAADNGVMEYHYQDAVKLAGHSCPTVVGAYLMTIKGLQALYGDEIPERGGVDVMLKKGREEGTTGVTASIATLLTGAATEQGFAGIGPAHRFKRRNLLTFNAEIDGSLALRRRDNGKTVEVTFHADLFPWSDEMMSVLLPRAVTGAAKAEELTAFKAAWQGRVATLLKNHANPELITVREIS